MILNDPKGVDIFQPDPDSPIKYHLKIPTTIDRIQYQREVTRAGGRNWNHIQMLETLEEGVRTILSEPEDQEQREEFVNAIREYKDLIAEVLDEFRQEHSEIDAGDEDNEDHMAHFNELAKKMAPPLLIRQIESVILDQYQPYADRMADREVYPEFRGMVAAKMFLVGWEGIEAKFKRTKTGVPDDTLQHISRVHMLQIGGHMQQLLEPGIARLKNFQSRSGTRGDPDRSNGIETPQETTPSETTAGPAQSSESENSGFIH